MAEEHAFILDLTIVLATSALGGYIANRLRQPVLLGYIVSGLLVGPFGLALLSELSQVQSLAEIGVAFLLFALGVEFSLTELRRVKDIALQGSLLQIGLTTLLVTVAALALGWAVGITQGIFLGAVLSLSSTAVVLKTLTERGEVNTVHGQIMLAILIAQDLALGVLLAILPALSQPEDLGSALLSAGAKVLLFLAGAIAFGKWIVPLLIRAVVATENNELFLLTTIALCLGVAIITASLGISIEIGAFVAGLMLSEVDYSDHALAKVLPLRDTFASLFFASIGMLIDPTVVWNNIGVIFGLVTPVMLGKAAIILPIILKFGYSLKTAITTSFGLNQIGEFSFVLALTGNRLGLISDDKYSLLLGTTAITLLLTPVWLHLSFPFSNFLYRIPLFKNRLSQLEEPKLFSVPETIRDHVVVAGFGRVGQVIVAILQSQKYPVLVIENSEAAIQRLRGRQIPYIFGDADSELVLDKAHLPVAKALAIALPDPNSSRILLQRALAIAPALDVIARSHVDKEIDLLTQLGAKEVVQPEFEAALELGSHLLLTLGTPAERTRQVLKAIRTDRYQSIRPARE
jgi:CPA2 family monovalent cation:H+ antiporter-2